MDAQQIPAYWREWWEERAAIMEVEGGLSRSAAEDEAAQCLVTYLKDLARTRTAMKDPL